MFDPKMHFKWFLFMISINFNDLVNGQTADECQTNIYENCLHRSEFTKAELRQVLLYIQNEFEREAEFKPVKPPCQQLKVRKDFKCMTENERMAFISAMRELYLDGTMATLTDDHARCWPAGHKTTQFITWHRYMVNRIDKELQRYDPSVMMPYWEYSVDFSNPVKSIIFKYFGKSGVHRDQYVVNSGPLYGDLDVPIKLRREWKYINNSQIVPWDSPEMDTFALHKVPDYLIFVIKWVSIHFLVHLGVGGYSGQMSVPTAPYDIIFWFVHAHLTDLIYAKLQLGNRIYLGGRTYNHFINIDEETGNVRMADIQNDRLCYYNDTTTLEVFQFGFGDFCTTSDQVVEAVLDVINNRRREPEAIRRLPLTLKLKYFPKFISGNYTAFDYLFPNVGNCNTQCKPVPQFQPYISTEEGRNQLRAYAYDANISFRSFLVLGNEFWKTFVADLNLFGYCSPYVSF